MRRILIGTVVVAAFFGGTLWALDLFFGDSPLGKRPALAEPPPLKPVSRMSTIIAPIAIANNAIRDVMEAQAPRNLTGKRDNPLSELLGKADIGWNMNRGPLAVAGRTDGMAIATTINGELRATGQIGEQAGQLTSQLGSMIGGSIGRQVGQLAGKPFDQKLAINGNVTVVAKPALQPNWRIEPNLTANVALADRAMNISGIKLNVMQEVKPLLDRTVNEQMAKLQAQLRNDPTLEQTARREWVKLCRSISLGPAGPNMPALWLEVKPTQAVAAQPKIDPNWLIVTGGVQAETRITPSETKPNCPFPAQLQIVPPMDQGKVAIAVPIDLPVHRAQPHPRSAAQGQGLPGRPQRPGAGDRAEGDAGRLRRQAADLAQGQGEGEEELVRSRRRRRRVRLGQAHARQQAADPALHRHDARCRFRRRRSASPAPWRTSRSRICRSRWPTRP